MNVEGVLNDDAGASEHLGDVLTSRGYQLGDIRGICTSLSLL